MKIKEVRRYPNYILVRFSDGHIKTYGLYNTPKEVWDYLEYFQEKGKVSYQGQAIVYQEDESNESVRTR